MADILATPRVFRLKGAAFYCGISASLLRKLDSEGAGPRKTRLGDRAVGWTREDLDYWIEERRRRPETERFSAEREAPAGAPVAATG